jgi:hypothetical protein
MDLPQIEDGLRRLLRPRDDDLPCSPALYRYAAGESSPEERQEFEAHLFGCRDCREALARFRQPQRRAWRRWTAAAAALLLVGVLAAAAWWLRRDHVPAPQPGALAMKGGFHLTVAVARGDRRFVAASGAELQAGDRLGFFYSSPTAGYLVLLFADENGTVARLYPPAEPERLPAGERVRLADGALVEPGSGCEWIVGVFTAERPDVARLEGALRGALRRREACQLPGLELPAAQIAVYSWRRGRP